MNNNEITRKEFLTISGTVLVFLFGGIASKVIKGVVTSTKDPSKQKVATNNTYGGASVRKI